MKRDNLVSVSIISVVSVRKKVRGAIIKEDKVSLERYVEGRPHLNIDLAERRFP